MKKEKKKKMKKKKSAPVVGHCFRRETTVGVSADRWSHLFPVTRVKIKARMRFSKSVIPIVPSSGRRAYTVSSKSK